MRLFFAIYSRDHDPELAVALIGLKDQKFNELHNAVERPLDASCAPL